MTTAVPAGGQQAIPASASAFGNHIDASRRLADLPHMVLVEVDAPEYERNELGRMVARTIRYEFLDGRSSACELLSIGAGTSMARIAYEDMTPRVLGTFGDVTGQRPDVARALFKRGCSPEMVALGVVRAERLGCESESLDVEDLLVWLNAYHRRSSWMEAHPLEVHLSNLDGAAARPFDWDRLLKCDDVGGFEISEE